MYVSVLRGESNFRQGWSGACITVIQTDTDSNEYTLTNIRFLDYNTRIYITLLFIQLVIMM